MSTGRICISTKQKHFLLETIHVVINGENFPVHVHELGTWNINIEDDQEIDSSEGKCNEEDNIDDSADVGSEEYWEDQLKQVDADMEENSKNSKEHNSRVTEKTDVLPSPIMEAQKHEDISKNQEESDPSHPPGFEHFKNQCEVDTNSSFSFKSRKCSTSFAKSKKKHTRGFSLIHEMSRMIEIEGTLGYDVTGCHRSLCKMINGIGVQESKMTRLELFRLKSMWGNYTFDYACSLARGRSGGLISLWDPNYFQKTNVWCDESFIIVQGKWNISDDICFMVNIYGPQDSIAKASLWSRLRDFMHHHSGQFILFEDLNKVREESERHGSNFSRSEAEVFNSFIGDTSLIDLPTGGRFFTWMNKEGTKMSKLDRFLVSSNFLDSHPDIKVLALEKLWSDHNPILLYVKKLDFGPLFVPQVNHKIHLHVKLKELKKSIKTWHASIKHSEASRKHEVHSLLKILEGKIDSGRASDSEREDRINLLQECDDIEKSEVTDLIQKAHIQWDIEGDENTKFFHGLIKQRRRQQMVQGLMIDGVWILDPYQVKEAFLNFFKGKFSISRPRSYFSSLEQHFGSL
ncbi:RNA-directed DNA polymerase, eukaryota, reverse transcriptase zinc-binding domain protein [Tanacetum coccineum]